MALVQWNGLWMREKDRGTEFNMSFQVGQVGQLDTRGRRSRMHRCSRYFWERDIFQDGSASEVRVSFGISTMQKLVSPSAKFTQHFTPLVLIEIAHLLRWCWHEQHLNNLRVDGVKFKSYKRWHAGTTLLLFLSNSYIPFLSNSWHFTLWFPVTFLGGLIYEKAMWKVGKVVTNPFNL